MRAVREPGCYYTYIWYFPSCFIVPLRISLALNAEHFSLALGKEKLADLERMDSPLGQFPVQPITRKSVLPNCRAGQRPDAQQSMAHSIPRRRQPGVRRVIPRVWPPEPPSPRTAWTFPESSIRAIGRLLLPAASPPLAVHPIPARRDRYRESCPNASILSRCVPRTGHHAYAHFARFGGRKSEQLEKQRCFDISGTSTASTNFGYALHPAAA
jgi:hypothetical protein